MADKKTRKAGPKLTRSKTVTIRLDPKLHYLAELGARVQRRTLSSFIEWAVEQSLSGVSVEVLLERGRRGKDTMRLNELGEALWDVYESNRFMTLALTCPQLLTFEEQMQWKVINDELLSRRPEREWDEEAADWVQTNWEEIKEHAAGEIDEKEFRNRVENNSIPF